ncbi:hypothetical protein C8J57DRAFT_1712825 [Mycena rebaudengoi]|nr:hypothetical protein C8J57DRAFT_1712825 [Mycena rebaudengoi]
MATPPKHVRIMAVFNPPTHLAAEEFERKLEAFVDSVLALPVAKKIITKYELCFSQDNLHPHIKGVGIPTPERNTIVAICEFKSESDFHEIAKDPAVMKMVEDSTEHLGLAGDTSAFMVRVVEKVKMREG